MSRWCKSTSKRVIVISVATTLVILLVCLVVYLLPMNSRSNPPVAGSYYIEETNETYQYELKMYGELPNSSNPLSFYVYTNDPNLSFTELSQRLISSHLPLSDRGFYISEDPIPNVG